MLAPLIARLRSLWGGIAHRRDAERELREEFAHHITLRAEDLMRSGVDAAEATRRARAEFGGAFNHSERVRAARGLAWFDALRFSALDFRLGARMLRKYPGLTVVSSLAIGVAITIGAGALTAVDLVVDPHLPLDEGDRIVALDVRNIETTRLVRRLSVDFDAWHEGLPSVRDLSAFALAFLNVAHPDGAPDPTRTVAMSAAGFRVARVAPMLGRYLIDSDEAAGAEPVAVLGYDLWTHRFGSDTSVVGRQLRIGGTMRTIVGVMPSGFAFPLHDALWVPLRIASGLRPGEGPAFFAFGRLAPGATLASAQAEMDIVNAALTRAHPEAYAKLRPRIQPFARAWLESDGADVQLAARTAWLTVALLLFLICSNVAILVYARTAARRREIVLRSALGATRARIVTQLFGEALVLSAVGAAIGLAAVWVIGRETAAMLPRLGIGSAPFWMRFDASPETVRNVVMLALAGASIIGIVPALRLTRLNGHDGAQGLAGVTSTLRLGKVWTALVVAQVATSVAVLPTTVTFSTLAVRTFGRDPDSPARRCCRHGSRWMRRQRAIRVSTRRVLPWRLRVSFARATSWFADLATTATCSPSPLPAQKPARNHLSISNSTVSGATSVRWSLEVRPPATGPVTRLSG